jgi:hypothetical protein
MDNFNELVFNIVRDYSVEITASITTYIATIRRFNTFLEHTQIYYDRSPHLRDTIRDMFAGRLPSMPRVNQGEFVNQLSEFINSLNNVYGLSQTYLYDLFLNTFEVSRNTALHHLISDMDANNIRLLYNVVRPFMVNLHETFVRLYSIVPYLEHIPVNAVFRTAAISTTVMIIYYIGRWI